jgi:uncharacterized protein YjbI with pentapeptide repeats
MPAGLEPVELAALTPLETYAEVALDGARLSGQEAPGVVFEYARLANTDLSESRLDRLRCVEVEVRGGNFANLAAREAKLATVTITGARLTGVRLTGASLTDVTVSDSRVDLAQFVGATLARVTFEDCRVESTDFSEARLDSVRFHRCDLGRCDFTGARLRRTEFRGCALNDVQGFQDLRGAAMEWRDILELAGAMAASLGIDVLEDE